MEYESELQRAIRFGDADAVAAFVYRGDDILTADSFGYSPLHYCALCGDPSVALIVIRAIGHGSPFLNKRTPYHQTALLLAAYHNNYNVYCLLLEYGADPNIEVMFGQTAFHCIVRQGKYKYIKKLILYGANVNWIDCFGLTPLRIHLAATMDIRITRLLIKNGADINETRFDQRAILVIALYRWRADNLLNFSYLMRHGADINAVNFIGDTALHFAARVASPQVVRLLVLNHGADITARNLFGLTPHDLAFQYKNTVTLETIRDLEKMEIERQMQALGI